MTQPSDFSLSNVRDTTTFPDLPGGTHSVSIKGLPEVYQSIGEGGRVFGNTLSIIVQVKQSATLPTGHIARMRIKGQAYWADATVGPDGQPNYEKSSGYRFLQQLRSFLLVCTGNVGKQVTDPQFAQFQTELLTGAWEGRSLLVEAKEKKGRVSGMSYTTYKFSPAQAA